jgi:hypothetical protein
MTSHFQRQTTTIKMKTFEDRTKSSKEQGVNRKRKRAVSGEWWPRKSQTTATSIDNFETVSLVSLTSLDESVRSEDSERSNLRDSLRLNSLASPMAQWTLLFEESGASSDEDEEYDSEEEDKHIQELVKAAFTPQIRTPSVSRLVGMSPDVYLQSRLAAGGVQIRKIDAKSIPDFFQPITPRFVESFTMEISKAVREEDIVSLRRLHKSGHSLLCGTKHGDSILHTACRRNSVKVVDFLLNECNIRPNLCCDFGRTPLHDACWTSGQPNFSLIRMLLAHSPDLLYITDVRGSTAFNYTKKEHWDACCQFLRSLPLEDLLPRATISTTAQRVVG